MSVNLKLSPTAKVIAGREAENFLNDVNGVTAVVIATVDGFDVASAMRAGDAARVAAMASSISAISSVVSQEANLGRNKSVTIDTESGFEDVVFITSSRTKRSGIAGGIVRPRIPPQSWQIRVTR